MKIKAHVGDAASYDDSLRLLLASDIVAHRKMIVECCVLASANLANMALHQIGKLKDETDIKHNRLEGFLRRSLPFSDDSFQMAKLVRILEDCKYKVVHGTSTSRQDISAAVDAYMAIAKLVAKNVPESGQKGESRNVE